MSKKQAARKFGIVDLFAGPGGLAEGFVGYQDQRGAYPFYIEFSVEMEESAHRTLLLRSFIRQFGRNFPDEYYSYLKNDLDQDGLISIYSREWRRAKNETLKLELGTNAAQRIISPRLKILDGRKTIVIGGPPCQAYSLAGRARNSGRPDYVPKKDKRNFMYQAYIDVLESLAPVAFVMENVKGLLSAKVDGILTGNKILSDLRKTCSRYGGYKLFSLRTPDSLCRETPELSNFVIHAENYGIPQARHRLIIVGIRSDLCGGCDQSMLNLLEKADQVPARAVLSSLPALRSGLSRSEDSFEKWSTEVLNQMRLVMKSISKEEKKIGEVIKRLIAINKGQKYKLNRAKMPYSKLPSCAPEFLREWIADARLTHVPNHETRGHMPADLGRYIFASVYAKVYNASPKTIHFPNQLAATHANWKTGKFNDRYRVQLANRPSMTITSHISKDGNYYIHPDPKQCRSLTVREAARLQTFPDNYIFLGNRTQQYEQVGNAVPPFLACQIASTIHNFLRQVDSMQA